MILSEIFFSERKVYQDGKCANCLHKDFNRLRPLLNSLDSKRKEKK